MFDFRSLVCMTFSAYVLRDEFFLCSRNVNGFCRVCGIYVVNYECSFLCRDGSLFLKQKASTAVTRCLRRPAAAIFTPWRSLALT